MNTRTGTRTGAQDDKSEPLFPYLRYATLENVRKELPLFLGAWVVVSILFGGIAYVVEVFWPASDSTPHWKNPLPWWLTVSILAALPFWFLRGKSFHWHWPRLSFKAWLGCSLWIAAILFLFEHAPVWVALPILWGSMMFFNFLQDLSAHGKENLEATGKMGALGNE
jgi:hypothetical protein